MNLTIGNTQKIIAAFKGDDIRHLAYMLAITHKETGGKMLPVRERIPDASSVKLVKEIFSGVG
jgi:hypothetical protein